MLWKLIVILLLYLLLCGALPPLLSRRPGASEASDGPGPDAAASAAGERVRSIDDNGEALRWRLRLIAAAEERAVLSTFDFRVDESGKDVLAALLAAAERGVQVKLLVDGLYGLAHLKYKPQFAALASAPNAEVRFYNPPRLWNLWRVNYRMHDKYLICDRRAYLLGGRNVHDKFLGAYSGKRNLDRDLLVCAADGSAPASLAALEAYFAEIWSLPCCRRVRPRGKGNAARAREELRARDISAPPADWLADTLEARSIALLTNPIRPWNKTPALWRSLCRYMDGAERAAITTPYLVPGRAMYRDLTALRAAGTEIEILTNAAENGANAFGSADWLNEKKRLRRAGISASEYAGGDSLHAKAFLIDGKTAIVGSFNTDMRSAYLDTETMLAVESPALAAHLEARTAALQAEERAKPENPRRYPILRRLTRPFRYLL